MTATIIPLHRAPTPAPVPVHHPLGEVVAALRLDGGQDDHSSVGQISEILSDLRRQQNELLMILANMRAHDLGQHPHIGRIAGHLEATICRTLAEIGLLIRSGENIAALASAGR